MRELNQIEVDEVNGGLLDGLSQAVSGVGALIGFGSAGSAAASGTSLGLLGSAGALTGAFGGGLAAGSFLNDNTNVQDNLALLIDDPGALSDVLQGMAGDLGLPGL